MPALATKLLPFQQDTNDPTILRESIQILLNDIKRNETELARWQTLADGLQSDLQLADETLDKLRLQAGRLRSRDSFSTFDPRAESETLLDLIEDLPESLEAHFLSRCCDEGL